MTGHSSIRDRRYHSIAKGRGKGRGSRTSQTTHIEGSCLLLLATKGVLDGLSGAAKRVLGRLENALALVGGIVTAGAGGVTELLGSRLVALCEKS